MLCIIVCAGSNLLNHFIPVSCPSFTKGLVLIMIAIPSKDPIQNNLAIMYFPCRGFTKGVHLNREKYPLHVENFLLSHAHFWLATPFLDQPCPLGA